MTKKTEDTDYKFRLIEYSRTILVESGYSGSPSFEDKIFKLAEQLHTWIKKDLNETE
jgi:hypothetical protein